MVELQGAKDDRTLTIIAVVLLVGILVLLSSFYVYYTYYASEEIIEEDIPTFTATFTNVTPEEAYEIINSTDNLTMVDCGKSSGCSPCDYKNKGHIPGSSQNSNPLTLYNSTNDILVYSRDEITGINFCLDLTNNVYGKIYNLAGGYDAWKEKGFPVNYGAGP